MTILANGQLKRSILQEVLQQPRTLADLQAQTPVSLPTLRRAINELIEMNWIRTVGQNIFTGGRPATLFGINGDFNIVIGAHAEIPQVNLVAVQLDGKVIDRKQDTRFDPLLPDHVVTSFTDYVHEIREKFPQRNILGIGMAAPGYIDAHTGDILFVGRAPGWENYPMRRRLEAETKLPLVMENDIDCSIRAEIDAINTEEYPAIIYLSVAEGVKASLMFDGNLYRGPYSNAGLIGRSKLAPRKDFDSYYDLEHLASVAGLCAIFEKRATRTPDTTTRRIQSIDDRNARYQAILECAAAGHPLCEDIITYMFDDLSLSITNLIYVLQPQLLFIGGLLSTMPDTLKAQLDRAIRQKLPPLLSNGLIINFARVTGLYASAIGATRWFMQRITTSDALFEQTVQLTINQISGHSYG